MSTINIIGAVVGCTPTIVMLVYLLVTPDNLVKEDKTAFYILVSAPFLLALGILLINI